MPAAMTMLRDVIIRHPKERKSKCSLEPLRHRADLLFLVAAPTLAFDATGFILLDVDAPSLGPEDATLPLLILDSTWRLLPQLQRCVHGHPLRRSLPVCLRTAYPRHSKISPDPASGLASVEALYAARAIQGRDQEGLLDQYRWKEDFLAQYA
ncbi:MAG: hypothetical protein RL648_970 [Verrucomicrobiota bacterium]|jgi:pre-rRNA-processing protein TSR3